MRLLIWYWGRRGAGAQRVVTLGRALRRRGDVAVALSVSRQMDLLAEVEALGLPTDIVETYTSGAGFLLGLPRVPGLARRLARQAREFRADAVLSVMTHLWTPLVTPALRRAGIPYVPIVHDALPHPGDPALLWDWRLDRELDAASGAIVHSAEVGRLLRARRPGLPVETLSLGTDLDAAALAPASGAAKEGGFLLFGRLRAYKGLDLLRDAWPAVLERHPGARLRVVGEGDAEGLAPGLSALPGVRVETRWVAEAEIPALAASADALVLPYREASQSSVVPLAFALGVPVVATAVGALAEQVADGVNGLVVPPEPAALAAAMARMADPAERARLAAGARASGAALVDWDARAAELLGVLRRLGVRDGG
ncbi:glycosyltransferase [Roseomonas sp. NAR14]|uniref:Glycosyltransferase n=1 Tax=Roseomonas acroporae TaxID=2937791 RepID=A0A9X1Y8U3_9PROT|nr:glycosyltransferase [Roseomonas acroporae]MCK8785643.1 glycosyltransferase [Roseomonas acroporae]